MWVEALTEEVGPRLHSSDVDPLAVQIAPVPVSTVGRYSLRPRAPTAVLTLVAVGTHRVLQTERRLVTLCDLCPRVGVVEVEIDKGLEGVVVVVAVVEYPLVSVQVRVERTPAPVVGRASKSDEYSVEYQICEASSPKLGHTIYNFNII